MKILFCDLTHTGAKIAIDSVPLGAGYVNAYLAKNAPLGVSTAIIKYPEELERQLSLCPPDIVAFSNYVWNNNLNDEFCRKIKRVNPGIITLRGGPNFPRRAAERERFLAGRAHTDAFVFYEAEKSFSALVQHISSRGERWKDSGECLGVAFIHQGRYVEGRGVPRIVDLTLEVPSPYLNGDLDGFLDGRLTPVIQRTRGCPFTCNYCNEGEPYYTKVNKFSTARVREELHYIGSKLVGTGVKNLFITDMNFGMFEEDREVVNAIIACQEKYRWPQTIIATSGKNNVKRISETLSELKNSVMIFMSMQSMNEKTLREIKRQNIEPKTYIDLAKLMPHQAKQAELIIPLPFETYDSYVGSVRFLMDAQVEKITTHTLQINMGSAYDGDDYLRRHGIQTRFRVNSNCFGRYGCGTVIDCEEVAVATDSMSYAEYVKARKIVFLTEMVYNNSLFVEYLHLLRLNGISPFELVDACLAAAEEKACIVSPYLERFSRETEAELFLTEQDLVRHYSVEKNYVRLKNGEEGRNVLFANKAITFTRICGDFIDFVHSNVMKIVGDSYPRHQGFLSDLHRFVGRKLQGTFDADPEVILREGFEYDILGWLASASASVGQFRFDQKEALEFFLDADQIAERQDLFSRYGGTSSGLSTIFARAPNHRNLLRKIRRARLNLK